MNETAEPETTSLRIYLVEHYWPGLTIERFESVMARVRSQAEVMAGAGQDVRFVRTTMVPGDEAAFCVFEAVSQDLVEQAYTDAGVTYERLSPAISIDDPQTPAETSAERSST